MSYKITSLSPEPFAHLFGLPDADLAAHGARRYVADKTPGFPDRIELRDAEPGESVLLVNYVHHDADTPYRASHAVFVKEGAGATYERCDEVPEALQARLLSLRAFDDEGMMIEADVVEGRDAERQVLSFFADPRVAYIHAHFAKRGCYAARIDRA